MKAKHIEITGMLQRRIREGIYSLSNLPSERKLAVEFGVSYMTARKAVQNLVKSGLVGRHENGRLRMRSAAHGARPSFTIGFVMPAPVFMWSAQWAWQSDLSQLVAQRNGVVRPITYASASDPVMFEALEGDFDGLVLILPPFISPLPVDRLIKKREQLVVLWQDTTHLGIPSIETGPSRFIGKLLDHLTELGHSRVDCLNAQSADPGMQQRTEHWRLGLEQRGLDGQLHEYNTQPFQPGIRSALEQVTQLLEQESLDTTALFCVNTSQAWGAMRACHNKGLSIGRDISICGFGEMDIAKLMIPTITAVEPAERSPFLEMGLEWIESRGRNWSRPLRLEPDDISLFIGESTGPVPKTRQHSPSAVSNTFRTTAKELFI